MPKEDCVTLSLMVDGRQTKRMQVSDGVLATAHLLLKQRAVDEAEGDDPQAFWVEVKVNGEPINEFVIDSKGQLKVGDYLP